jgi:excinuclease UvrABC nuclease subunit
MVKKLKQDIIKNPDQIPDSPGVFRLHIGEEILYLSKASNLRRSINKLLSLKPEDEQILKMISLTKEISWDAEESVFAALLKEKIELSKGDTQFNRMLKDYTNYAYLQINFSKVPYFNISEDTLKDDYYIGPFFDRFFPLDFIAIMGQLKKYPDCETESYPCYKYKDKSCDGWCLRDTSELSNIIAQSYLTVNGKLLEELHDRQQILFDQLEFVQENNLKDQVKHIKKFYDYLRFFHIVKKLDMNITYGEHGVKISNGQIESITCGKDKFHFPVIRHDYRPNEILAIDKEQLTESRIVYNFIKKKHSQKTEELYLDSAQNLLKELGFKVNVRIRTILVVDDEKKVTEFLKLELEDNCSNIKVITANSGYEGLSSIMSGGVDLLLTDIAMPDMDGYELFSRTKEMNSELPIIMMTGFGYDPNHVVVKSRMKGLKDVIFKPFDTQKLVKMIRERIVSGDSGDET